MGSQKVERVGTGAVAEQLGVTRAYLRYAIVKGVVTPPVTRGGRGRGGGFLWGPQEIKNAKSKLAKLAAKANA
jgi:hypothetical protein